MATPQEDAAQAEQTRDRLEQAAIALFATYVVSQQMQGEEDGAELPRVDILRIRRLISETVGWYLRELSRISGIDNQELERDDVIVELLLPDVIKQVKSLREWVKNSPPRDPSELSLQRNAARALATTVFNSIGHTVTTNVRRAGPPFSEKVEPAYAPLRKIWITRKDSRVRKLHRKLHGTAKDMDADFFRWPATGQRLRFPGDPMAPLDATINCRCVLVMSAMDLKDVKAAFPPLPPEDED